MQHLLLLHGALGAKNQFLPLTGKLNSSFIIHTINFSGHGGAALPAQPLSIPLFAEEVLHYMSTNNITQASIFGYSMGGYVGMYLAKQHAEKVNKIITLASKFYWDEAIAAREIKMLDADTLETKVPAFAHQLAARHAPTDWKLLLQETAIMMTALGKNNTLQIEDYASIDNNCLLMLGDRDKMVGLDETINVYKKLPNAQMCVLPGTPHPFEQVNTDLLAFMIERFLQ